VKELPPVSIVIPCYNEARYITALLDSIRMQRYPLERLEVLIADGMSTDNTREIIASYATKHQNLNIRILDNLGRAVSCAMNVGIRATRGDFIVVAGGHSQIDSGYVARCVDNLLETGAWNVGGLLRTEGEGYIGRAIALAITSPFGMGGSKFRYAQEPQYVDTVYPGAFPRWIFDRVGLYDERFHANEDYEFNYRLRKAGGKIFLATDIRPTYFCRNSLRRLWQQHFRYGFWKVQTIRKHPRSMRIRHSAAPAFVAALLSSLLLSLDWRPAFWLFVAIVTIYLALAIAFAVLKVREEERSLIYLPILPVIFATLHLAWGLGFWWALVSLFFGNDPLREKYLN
jgi:succinoglycan biosynthesis protein ExoA